MSRKVRQRWLWGGSVACALIVGALLGAAHPALLRAPADFSIYYAAARVLASGRDPYNWHTLQQMVPQVIAPGYVYPLWALLPALVVAWLPLPVAAGVWLAASCCCLIYAVWTLGRAAGMPSRSYWLPGLVGVVCLSIPGLFVLIQGQISLLLLAALVGAYVALASERPHWAGVLIALALAKPQLTVLPVLALLLVAWRHDSLVRATRWLGGTLAALVLLSFAVRPTWPSGWLAALTADAGVGGPGSRSLRANMGTIPALSTHLPPVVGLCLLLASIAAGAWLSVVLTWRLRAKDSTRAELELLAGSVCVGTVLSPWMWIYDGVLWLVPLIALVRWGSGWRRWFGLAAFWLLPWGIRLWHVAGSTGGGTSLNKLEDVLIAPLLLAALFAPSPRNLIHSWRERLAPTPASAPLPATRSAQQNSTASKARSVGQARRPAVAPHRPSRRG